MLPSVPQPVQTQWSQALQSKTLPSLDGLRAIAVLLVVLYHYGYPLVNGGTGVLIFFVLSGFLITWLLLREEQSTGRVSLRAFYLRRSLRIFPAFYVYWVLVVVGAGLILRKNLSWPQSWAAFFYVTNYWQAIFGDPNTGLSHTWSLAIEEQFYLFWPFLFRILATHRRRVNFLAAAIAAVWLNRAILRVVVGVNPGYTYWSFDCRIDHLLIGCLLAVSLFHNPETPFWRSITRRPAFFLIPATLLAVSQTVQMMYGDWFRDMIGFTIDPWLVMVMIPQAIAFRASTASWLNFSPLRYLGRISYSIYLYQQIVIHPVQKLTGSLPDPVRLICTAGAVVLVASGSFYLVEKPFLRLKERFQPSASKSAGVPRISPLAQPDVH